LWCRAYARSKGLNEVEVQKAIVSFFDDIVVSTRKLPFDNIRRIYTADAVEDKACVYNIPYIGRLGPVYSQYLKWRGDIANDYELVLREDVRGIHLNERIEELAGLALSGHRVTRDMMKDPIPAGMYHKVWIIDKEGRRRAAKQLFKKQ
jgi:hypothetical protein